MMGESADSPQLTFWDHLDELRGVILRSLAVTLLFGIVAFIFKENLFDFVLAPKSPGFVTYRLLGSFTPLGPLTDITLINTGLAQQFVIHMKTAFCIGFLAATPYILYQIFHFVAPALYANERRYAVRLVLGGYIMFFVGAAMSYYIIFPVTVQFLGNYQVDADVSNLITLDSYMSTLIIMTFSLGIVCELPVVSWLCARFGLLRSSFLRTYRRHAIVVILIVAAIITPTSDIFTLLLVSLPVYILYEASILLVAISNE